MSNLEQNKPVGAEVGSLDGVKIVAHREGRIPKGLMTPLVIVVVAGFALALRAAAPDWRGLTQETQARLGTFFKSKKADPKPVVAEKAKLAPVVIAKADLPKPAAETPKPAEAAKAPGAWDDIRKEAEKKKAEQAEAERLKKEAEAELAKAKLPPRKFDRRGGAVPDPALVAQMLAQRDQFFRDAEARHEQMLRQMQAQMGDMGFGPDFDRIFEEQRRQHEQLLGRIAPGRRHVPNPPDPALPDFFGRPRQGMPFVEEKSGEKEVNGVRMKWRTRTIVIGPDGAVVQ